MAYFPNPFRSRRSTPRDIVDTQSASVPAGTRVFAFGDVHGRSDLLGALQQRIAEITRESSGAVRSVVVGLGDYVDRGPDTPGVIEILSAFAKRHETILIRGNHDALLMDFLENPRRNGRLWVEMGGWETLVSYGVKCSPGVSSMDELVRIRNEFAAALPPEHLGILASTQLSATIGDYFFVHAGARPGVPLARLAERDALWIRDGFADRDEAFEKVVIHGHTPTKGPFVGRHRINLDTGAYATNKLSCVVLEGGSRRFLEVTG